MHLWSTAAALTLFVSAAAFAQGGQPERPVSSISIHIVEYGIYTSEEKIPATGMNETLKPAGITKICHVQTTLVVPARDKLNFGFRYRVDGPVPGAVVEIKQAVKWPNHLNPLGAPPTYVANERIRRLRAGQTTYTGWINWQTMPGTWTFELFHADHKLAELSFTVVEKGQVSIQPDGDSTCFQLSSREGEMKWHST